MQETFCIAYNNRCRKKKKKKVLLFVTTCKVKTIVAIACSNTHKVTTTGTVLHLSVPVEAGAGKPNEFGIGERTGLARLTGGGRFLGGRG